jgi:polysaccharide export outer membrane protein
MKNRFRLQSLLAIAVLGILASCTPTSKLKYVINEGGNQFKNDFYNDRSEKLIQPYDYLYVRIFSLDQRTNDIFNDRQGGTYNTELLSYPVDDNGNINLPFIGLVSVKGLTINQAKDKIESALAKSLNNVSIVVRFISNKVTILGEVNQPGQYSFYDEKVNVFQAIGFANGSTTYGDLTNITLIRDQGNTIIYHYLDLTKKDIAASEYYYLLPNDVLIINPIRAKYRGLRDYTLTIFATVLGSVTTLLTAITLYNSLNK